MKTHLILLLAPMSLLPHAVSAQTEKADTIRSQQLQEAVVKAVRASRNAPFATTNISQSELSTFAKQGRELPFLFAQTPGIVAWSENGLGNGTTYMRIRGAAGSRINVTLDGVELNSPEDQSVFWVNTNSYASFLKSVQIQRGVGTSSTGDGALGGSIVMQTLAPATTPSAEVSASLGSYGTWNAGANVSTGLIANHLAFDAAYHHTGTDGYIHGTGGNSGSFYGSLAYIADNWSLTYKNIGNYEHTGQAWNGIDTGSLLDGNYGVSTGLNSYGDFYRAGLGRYNTLYEALVDDGDPSKGTERYRLKNGKYWKRTTDKFTQDHNLLTFALSPARGWNVAATLRYTYGQGGYNEFRPNNKLSKFGLENFTLSDGTTLKRSDFIREKNLTQNTYGATAHVNYTNERWDVVAGGNAQLFSVDHYGYLTYVGNDELAEVLTPNGGNYTYYTSDATKQDQTYFIKAAFKITPHWRLMADWQYRHVRYRLTGHNDKFHSDLTPHVLDIRKKYDFFNPKFGVSYTEGPHRAFASIARSHREPERNCFTDNGSYPLPKAEELTDIEVGYTHTARRWNAGVTLYYMSYDDQLVQTGEVSDIGEALTTNVNDSYRMGIELTAAYRPTNWLDLSANAAFSRNIIRDFDEVVEDWDNGSQTIHYDHSTLAYSPSAIVNGFATLHFGDFQASWHTAYVSRQYLDNSEQKSRSLRAYTQSDIAASYTFHLPKLYIRDLVAGLNLNNVFNSHYAASGWVYSAICESAGHTNANRYRQIGYIPMAGFNVMGNLTFRF